MRHRSGPLALSLLLLPIAATAALPATPPAGLGIDASKAIAVNADNFGADLTNETGLYSGNVIVSQGAIRLHADRLKISAPKGKPSRMEVDGHVIVDSPSGQAVGDSGVYEVNEQILRLTGNVVLTKDANVLRGSALEVSMATGVARLSAGAQGTPGRVQGLFVPPPNANAASAPAASAAPAPATTAANAPNP